MQINCSPVLEMTDLLPMTHSRIVTLPDIMDIRCGHIGIAFYFYPISGWHWRWNIEKQAMSMNSLTPWASRYCCELALPTVHIEYVVL